MPIISHEMYWIEPVVLTEAATSCKVSIGFGYIVTVKKASNTPLKLAVMMKNVKINKPLYNLKPWELKKENKFL